MRERGFTDMPRCIPVPLGFSRQSARTNLRPIFSFDDQMTVEERRLRLEEYVEQNDHFSSRRVSYDPEYIDVPECECLDAHRMEAVWVTADKSRRERSILYVHGGGYSIGSIKTHNFLAARLPSPVVFGSCCSTTAWRQKTNSPRG